jgi:hypothetical protein
MSSFYAQLTVDGQPPYPLRQCQFEFTQATDQRGRAAAKVRHGLLHLTLDVPTDDQLLDWANTVHKPLSGHLTFFEDDRRTARETVSFAAGQCVSYQETFVAGDGEAGAYVCQLLITSAELTLAPGGAPQPFVAPAARDYVTAAPMALAPVDASPATHWHDDLATLMGPAVDVPATIAAWVAGGLSENKLRSAMRGAVDKKLVFQRLQHATDLAKKGKGPYQQRVIIDDYDNIPGVHKEMYSPNGLLQLSIPASDFGVDDPALDLPDFNAPTFTDHAALVELKPNETIYRVTNDPSISEFAHVGGYWTRTPPADLAEVIGGTAVMPEWNNFQRVYAFTVPPYTDPINKEPKFYAWEGPTAAQPVSGDYPDKIQNGYSLPGGASQLFLPEKIRKEKAYNFSSGVQDVTSLHKSW